MEPQFGSTYAKLDRGEEHLAELHELLVAYMSRPDVVTGFLAHGPGNDGKLTILGMDHRAVAVIGDVVHNLRSALDHVTWQLVLANGGSPKEGGGGTQFPIETDAEKAPVRVRAERGGVSAAALATIEAAQPYNNPDPNRHPLAVLHHVSNTDKHREPVRGDRRIRNLVSWSGTGDTTKPWVAPVKTQNPTIESVEIVLAEVPAVLGDGGASADYAIGLALPGQVLDDPEPKAQAPLYRTLDEMAWYVRQLVDDLVATTV